MRKYRAHKREHYHVVKLGYMGFPKDWEKHPLWLGKKSSKFKNEHYIRTHN